MKFVHIKPHGMVSTISAAFLTTATEVRTREEAMRALAVLIDEHVDCVDEAEIYLHRFTLRRRVPVAQINDKNEIAEVYAVDIWWMDGLYKVTGRFGQDQLAAPADVIVSIRRHLGD